LYILGEAGVGKSTASQYLQNTHGFVEIALADPMKRALHAIYGFTQEQLWGESAHRNAPDPRFPRMLPNGTESCLCPREALQTLGEGMRGCYPETWIQALFAVVSSLADGGKYYHPQQGICASPGRAPVRNFIVPDVRYRNEHLALKARGGIGIRLVSVLPVRPGLEGKMATHVSEVEQRSIPDEELFAVVVNDGSLQDLYRKLAEIVQQVKVLNGG